MLTGKDRLSEKGKWIGYWRHEPLHAKSSIFREMHSNYDAAIVGAAAFKSSAKDLRDAGKLTPKGIKEKLVERAVKDLSELKTLGVKATRPVRRDIDARLRQMKPVEISANDLAGELRRREIRDKLAAMPEAKRTALVTSTTDDAVLDAVLGASRLLVDLPDSVFEEVKRRRLEQRYGDEMRVLNAIGEAADTVDRAFEAARDEIRLTLGMQGHEFEAFAATVEAPIIERWKKGFETTAVDTSGPVFKAAADRDLAGAIIDNEWREEPIVNLEAAKRKADVDRRPAPMEGAAA